MSFFKRGLILLGGVGEKLGGKQINLALGDFNQSSILDSTLAIFSGSSCIAYYI